MQIVHNNIIDFRFVVPFCTRKNFNNENSQYSCRQLYHVTLFQNAISLCKQPTVALCSVPWLCCAMLYKQPTTISASDLRFVTPFCTREHCIYVKCFYCASGILWLAYSDLCAEYLRDGLKFVFGADRTGFKTPIN